MLYDARSSLRYLALTTLQLREKVFACFVEECIAARWVQGCLPQSVLLGRVLAKFGVAGKVERGYLIKSTGKYCWHAWLHVDDGVMDCAREVIVRTDVRFVALCRNEQVRADGSVAGRHVHRRGAANPGDKRTALRDARARRRHSGGCHSGGCSRLCQGDPCARAECRVLASALRTVAHRLSASRRSRTATGGRSAATKMFRMCDDKSHHDLALHSPCPSMCGVRSSTTEGQRDILPECCGR